ncbi:MAG: redoxin domain-containing protein [Deferrisomatales bacterium]|nr:redoxin domain-containing protein [Deferrisomatales bacterium]
MNKSFRVIRLVALIALVLCVVVPAAAAFKYVEVGQAAPAFTLATLGGESVSLADTVVGAKATAVVFWAAWSPRSKPMLAELEVLHKSHGAAGLRVLAVNVEHEELDAAGREQVASAAAGLSFPVLLDTGLATYNAYGVVATPTLALLDGEGTVRYVRASFSTSAKLEIEEQVLALLGLVPVEKAGVHVEKRSYVPPKKATLHYQKAQVLIQRGRPQRAVGDLEKAAELDPQWAEPRVLLARIYRGLAAKQPAMLEKAAAVLTEAEQIQPRHVQTLALHAEILVQLGRTQDALAVAERALAVDSGFTPALLAKSQALRALGDLGGARTALDEALSLNPRDPVGLAERGELESAAGNWKEAAAAFRVATEAAMSSAGGER